jgi:hypothetical protein
MEKRSKADASSIKKKDPDRGPPMMEGAHHFDKGYDSDEETFSPSEKFPDNDMRGNAYFAMRNKAHRLDSEKLGRSKFSKIH